MTLKRIVLIWTLDTPVTSLPTWKLKHDATDDNLVMNKARKCVCVVVVAFEKCNQKNNANLFLNLATVELVNLQ